MRDILCFTPLAIVLPGLMEKSSPGSGIDGILYAAPMADLAAMAVILTVTFFRNLKKGEGKRQERKSSDSHGPELLYQPAKLPESYCAGCCDIQ